MGAVGQGFPFRNDSGTDQESFNRTIMAWP